MSNLSTPDPTEVERSLRRVLNPADDTERSLVIWLATHLDADRADTLCRMLATDRREHLRRRVHRFTGVGCR